VNILLLAPQPFYQDRGTPIAVKLLAQTLAGQGHIVHLLVFAEGEDMTFPGVTLHRHIRLPFISGVKPGLSLKKLVCDLFFFVKCIQLVRRYDFQLLHAVEESVFMALLVKKMFNISYVYDMDSCMSVQIVDKFPQFGLLRRAMEWMEEQAVTASAGVVAVCKSLEDAAGKYAPDTLIARIEDVTLLEPCPDGDENLRRDLGITGALLMYVGNLEKYQGIDLLLEAFCEALPEEGKLSLVLIGGKQEDIDHYRQRTKELDIASKVFFCGPRPVKMLGFYLSQADILVSPRTQGENTPMKIYSYLDSGKPVLATNLPTHTQVLDQAVSCLVEPTAEDMAAGMIQLAGDKDMREQIALQAKERVENEYSRSAFKRKLSAFYESLQSRLELSN
jgi:glycosyltransferase involved in cell wall biosynthesis